MLRHPFPPNSTSIKAAPVGANRDQGNRRVLLGALVFSLVAPLGLGMPLSAAAAGNPPVAAGENWEVLVGGSRLVNSAELVQNDTDPEGGTLVATQFSTPLHGNLNQIGKATYYEPTPGYIVQDSFTSRVKDPQGNLSNLAIVRIEVIGFSPVDDAYTVSSGGNLIVPTAIGVMRNDANPSNMALTVEVTTPTGPGEMHGSFTMSPDAKGGFRYHPQSGFTGDVTFAYRLKDAAGNSSAITGAVVIHVASSQPVVTAVQITHVAGGAPAAAGR